MTQQQIAIVTGGSSGIGQAAAARLRESGYHTVVLDLAEPPAGCADVFIRCDVGDPARVQESFARISMIPGTLTALVNAAGIGEPVGGIESIDPEVADRVIRTNLFGPFLMTKHAVPLMKRAGRGSIVNISSITGIIGSPGYPVYSATKGGLIAMGTALARELARCQIRVNTICPGSVPSTAFIRRQTGRDLELHERMALIKKIPLARLTQPDDIARWIAFLCSPDSSPTTGAVITIDGGELFCS